MRCLIPLICLFVLITTTKGIAQNSKKEIPKRTYTTKRIENANPPEIDGYINEPIWDLVPYTTSYTQLQPDIGAPPTEQTKMKIIYDASYIYVAFVCLDQDPDGIEKRLSRRDGFAGDWVEISFDSYNDDRTAFSFTLTAAGVKADEFISNNTRFDETWNPIWYTKTRIDDFGWTAEIKIPLSQLRFNNDKDQVWGLQSKRFYFRNRERSLWQEIVPNAPGYVSEFGELRGLKDLTPQKQLEIQPYVVTQLDTYESQAGNPYRDGSDSRLNAGLDAKIGITNDLTLDLTLNPDFGQVEADPAAIALDGFQIFFKEQRPFFVANSNIFDYDLDDQTSDNLFYSRRIGRSPQRSVRDPEVVYTDSPQNSTILGAAKFSGKTKNGWTLGLLESLTDKEFANTLRTDNTEQEVLVEPLTNYIIGRAQKDFNNRNSYIGVIATATNRKLEPQLEFLHRDAFSGGIDFKHNWNARKYYIEGNTIISNVHGSEEAITRTQRSLTHLFDRADATHLSIDTTRTSLTGTGGNLEIGKASGGNFTGSLGTSWKSPELELNDVGFLRQADLITQYANLQYTLLNPTQTFRNINVELEQQSVFDFEGNYNRIQYNLESFLRFNNTWEVSFGINHKPRIISNTELRGGPRLRFNQENVHFLFINSDTRKKITYGAGYVLSQATQNNFSYFRLEAGLEYQPLDALSLSFFPEYELSPNKTQYVSTTTYNGTKRYILGNIDQKTLSATLRLNYSVNPNLSVQYYAQPFVSKGEYTNFNRINNSTAKDLNNRITLFAPNQISKTETNYEIDENIDGTTDYRFSDPDFSVVQLRTNLVVRWEYVPGSELFFVWSQGANGNNEPDNTLFNALDNQVIQKQLNNTFLIKATYRFLL